MTTQALIDGGRGGLCPCHVSIFINILVDCHGKFEIRIEEGWLTEPVTFFIGHNIHYKTMFFLFNSVLYFPDNYQMDKDKFIFIYTFI